MGRERSIEDYQRWCGVDYRRRTVAERALRGLFIEGIERYRQRPIAVGPQSGAARAATVAPEAAAKAVVAEVTDTVAAATVAPEAAAKAVVAEVAADVAPPLRAGEFLLPCSAVHR